MQRGLFFSLVLHLTVIVVAWIGLPTLAEHKLVDDSPIVVQMVDVADKTNVPAPTPQAKKTPKPETPPAPPKAKEVPKPPEPKSPPVAQIPPPPPQPKPKPQKQAKVEPAPAPEPKPKPEPKKQAKAEPAPKPEKPKKQAEKKPQPKPEKKPAPKPLPRLVDVTPPKKPKAPKAPEQFQLTSVMKTLEKIKQQQETKAKEKPKKKEKPKPQEKSQPVDTFAQQMRQALANKQSKNFDPTAKISQSEIDAVKRQLRRCWNPPPGGKNAQDMVISIHLNMNPDGTVQQAQIVDKTRMATDPFFRASAEAGLRAVLNPRCSPLKLPPDKYQQWQQITLNFNPKEMY